MRSTSHPTELLAPYADGTLPHADRARVEAHLQSCPTCPEEVGLARAALLELSAIQEESVPFGVTAPVLERTAAAGTGRWSATSASARHARWRSRATIAIGSAAAASIAIVLALSLSGTPNQAASGGSVAAPASGEAAKDNAVRGVGLEQQSTNYDAAALRSLADSVKVPTMAAETSPNPSATPERVAAPAAAITCLERAGASFSAHDRPVRLIQARFEGTPAYLGVFLEGPAGQPPDHVAIWVVATSDCRVLTLVSEPR